MSDLDWLLRPDMPPDVWFAWLRDEFRHWAGWVAHWALFAYAIGQSVKSALLDLWPYK